LPEVFLVNFSLSLGSVSKDCFVCGKRGLGEVKSYTSVTLTLTSKPQNLERNVKMCVWRLCNSADASNAFTHAPTPTRDAIIASRKHRSIITSPRQINVIAMHLHLQTLPAEIKFSFF
jgi:hypothetical protein